jgi:hypothetical protein
MLRLVLLLLLVVVVMPGCWNTVSLLLLLLP